MFFDHIVGGLRFRADQRIPGTTLAPVGGDPHVMVHFGSLPAWFGALGPNDREVWLKDPPRSSTQQPAAWGWRLNGGAFFQIVYGDGTTFVIGQAGREIWATWPAPLTLEDTATFLLGPLLGFVLRLHGFVCLHASAFVAPCGRAVAVAGPPGHGKSTTAAAFARRGLAVLTDDVAVLRTDGTGFHVVPTYPQIKLWSASTAFLFGSPDALQRISPTHPTWDKRFVDLADNRFAFATESVPLSAVYVLQPRVADPAAPFASDLPPRARLDALLANTYATQFMSAAGNAKAFPALARIAGSIPVRALTPHSDPARIDRLCDLILEDSARRVSLHPGLPGG